MHLYFFFSTYIFLIIPCVYSTNIYEVNIDRSENISGKNSYHSGVCIYSWILEKLK
jgi:hypothetical protein